MNALRLAAAAVALSSVCASARSDAYVRAESNWDPSTLPIPYGINLSTAPSQIGATGARSAVEAAFASWAAPVCTTWRTTDTGNVSRQADTNDMLNTILWVSGSWPAELGDVNSTIGITTPVWQTPGYFIDADIQFNNVGFTWSLDGSPNTVDTQSIATHEEGHFLGLNHSPDSSAIMYASYSGGIKRALTSDDTMGVCAIYPSGMTGPTDSGTQDTGTTPVDSGMMMTGTGTTGSPCSTGTDCSSGICVTATDTAGNTQSFCTSLCTTDCDCPTGGWQCYATNTPGTNVCGPGTNSCSMPAQDAGSGMSPFAGPCSTGTDCASGICATDPRTNTNLCTRACNDDCTCPNGYHCFPTGTAGYNVCGAGTNTCPTMMSYDGGFALDAATDATGSSDAASHDGARADATGENTQPVQGGCHCEVASHGIRPVRVGAALVLLGLAFATRRRRRG